MNRTIKLYSFADVDRSGKARWTACELGYEIEESKVSLGDHRKADYLALNPYGQIPVAIINGETYIESSAICISLAEKHPEAGLIPEGGPQRSKFWELVHLTSSTLEMPVVNYFLASLGFANESWPEIVGEDLKFRLNTFSETLPGDNYLCGDFSIADICAGYVLRIGLQAGLLEYSDNLAVYMDRLRARPAASKARIFDALNG